MYLWTPTFLETHHVLRCRIQHRLQHGLVTSHFETQERVRFIAEPKSGRTAAITNRHRLGRPVFSIWQLKHQLDRMRPYHLLIGQMLGMAKQHGNFQICRVFVVQPGWDANASNWIMSPLWGTDVCEEPRLPKTVLSQMQEEMNGGIAIMKSSLARTTSPGQKI